MGRLSKHLLYKQNVHRCSPPLTMPQPLTILFLLVPVTWLGLACPCTDTTKFALYEMGLSPLVVQVSVFLRKANVNKTKMWHFFFSVSDIGNYK